MGDEDDLNISGFTRGMAVASFATDLYDNIGRSLFLTALYDRTWNQEIRDMVDGVEDRIAQAAFEIYPLNPETTIDLVKHVLISFYDSFGVKPPYPLYPFDEKEIQKLGKEKPTVREVMRWYADKWPKEKLTPPNPIEKIRKVYKDSLSDIEDDFFDSSEQIATALAFGFKHLVGKTIENVTIESIQREIRPKASNNGYINFMIVGQEDGKTVKIAVATLQDQGGRGVGAGIKRLTWNERFGMTRGCLVRSKSVYNWQVANRHLDVLLNQQGGEWVSPKVEEIRPLVILRELAQTLEDEGFSQTDFERFMEEDKLLTTNPVLTEILSDPSGQNPTEVEDEDAVFDHAVSEQQVQLSAVPDESNDLELLEAS